MLHRFLYWSAEVHVRDCSTASMVTPACEPAAGKPNGGDLRQAETRNVQLSKIFSCLNLNNAMPTGNSNAVLSIICHYGV